MGNTNINLATPQAGIDALKLLPSGIFGAAYIASRDPRIQALFSIGDPAVRRDTAYALAMKGLAIDVEIDINGGDPLLTMEERQNDGMKWVPNALQPNIFSSITGAATPNPPFQPYDADHMPEGALLVSTNPDDFKPFPLPPVPAAPPAPDTMPHAGDKLVGPAKTPTLYDLTTLARQKQIGDGKVWTLEGDGHVYILHVVSFGAKIWERTS